MMVLEPFPNRFYYKNRLAHQKGRLESFPKRRIDLFMNETGYDQVSTQTLVSYIGIDTKFNPFNPVVLRKNPIFVLKSYYQKIKGGATERTRLMLCCPLVDSLHMMKNYPLDQISGEK